MRLLVLALGLGAVVGGVHQAQQMPVDALPDFAPPRIEVQTEAPGLSAPEVENLVTLNLEELLNGTPWLTSIHSNSLPGLSDLLLTFQPGTDVLRARQLVNERLTLAYTIPNVAQAPVILQPQSSTNRVMMIGMSANAISPIEMGVLTRWDIRPALLAVPGVANVAVWGQREQQLQVQVDPARLIANNVSVDQVIETTGNAMWFSPLSFLQASTPGSGGWIDTPQQRLEVRHVFPIYTPRDLANVTIDGARPLKLGDVAKVVENHQPLIGDAVLTNGPDMLLVIQKFPNANTLDVTRGVEAALDKLRPGLPGIHFDTSVSRPATFIDQSRDNLTTSFAAGAVLLVLGLLVLLGWRSAIVGAVSTLTGLGAALLVLGLRGETANLMLVAGLVIAVAVLVDDAVIGTTAVLRRARERSAGETSTSALVLEETLRTRRGTAYAVLIGLSPLLAFALSEGMARAVIEPVVVSYVLAVLASLLVALTVTPVLTTLLLAGPPARPAGAPLVGRLDGPYSRALGSLARRPAPVLVGAGVVLVLALASAPVLGQGLLPSFRDPDVVVHFDGPPGTSEPEMDRLTTRVQHELAAIPGVDSVGAHVGRAVLGDQIADVNSAELWLNLDPNASYDATMAAVHQAVAGYPGVHEAVHSYLDDRVQAFDTGSTHTMTVRVFGPAFGPLATTAHRLAGQLRRIPGVRAATIPRPATQPTVDVKVNLNRAKLYGLKPGDVRRASATMLAGLEVGSLYRGQKVFQVMVWSTPDSRRSITSIKNVLIETPTGGKVPLSDVASVRIAATPTDIQRDQVSRRIDIGVDVSGRDPSAVAGDIQRLISGSRFPLEYRAEVIGSFRSSDRLHQRMAAAGFAALVAIFLLLQAAFQSWRLAALMLLTLPFSLSGGILGALVSRERVTLPVLAAMLAVLLVAARGAVALVTRARELEAGGERGPGAMARAARERLPVTLTTTLAAMLALAPLVVTGTIAGQEIAHPIAIVVVGGLLTTALVSLFLVPTVYVHLGPHAAPARALRAATRALFTTRRRDPDATPSS